MLLPLLSLLEELSGGGVVFFSALLVVALVYLIFILPLNELIDLHHFVSFVKCSILLKDYIGGLKILQTDALAHSSHTLVDYKHLVVVDPYPVDSFGKIKLYHFIKKIFCGF